MKNIVMIVFLLWVGGVLFVAAGMGILRLLDILENNYD